MAESAKGESEVARKNGDSRLEKRTTFLTNTGAAILWMIFGTDSGTKSSSHNKTGTSTYPRYHTAPVIDEEDSTEEDLIKEDGEYDCIIFNTSTGNGPYTLSCEKDSGTIIINFPNGGYIVVDEDGFHPPTGHHWDVELY